MKTAVLVLFIFCATAIGQTITPEMRTAANDAYQKQDWKSAAAAYEGIVKVEEKNAGANYRLGLSYLNLNDTAKAAKHLEAAMAISANPISRWLLHGPRLAPDRRTRFTRCSRKALL